MPPGKAQLGEINQELAGLFTEFSAKVLADENTWTVLDSEADLAGLPDSLVAAAKAAAGGARARRQVGDRQHALERRPVPDLLDPARPAREGLDAVQEARRQRRRERHQRDDRAIVKLRAERAKLLGYATHAHWRMADTMAKDPERARELMMQVWPAAVARVKEEVADMQAIADTERRGITIEPWDYLYYAEKVRKAKYDLEQNEIKPYFELGQHGRGAFWAAEQLYGSRFARSPVTVPVFHPDVRVWEVTDTPTGAHRGLFYFDNFARAGKRSGAWAIALPHAEHVRRPASRRSRRTTTTSSRARPASRC